MKKPDGLISGPLLSFKYGEKKLILSKRIRKNGRIKNLERELEEGKDFTIKGTVITFSDPPHRLI